MADSPPQHFFRVDSLELHERLQPRAPGRGRVHQGLNVKEVAVELLDHQLRGRIAHPDGQARSSRAYQLFERLFGHGLHADQLKIIKQLLVGRDQLDHEPSEAAERVYRPPGRARDTASAKALARSQGPEELRAQVDARSD